MGNEWLLSASCVCENHDSLDLLFGGFVCQRRRHSSVVLTGSAHPPIWSTVDTLALLFYNDFTWLFCLHLTDRLLTCWTPSWDRGPELQRKGVALRRILENGQELAHEQSETWRSSEALHLEKEVAGQVETIAWFRLCQEARCGGTCI